jgi:hypothetical protein
MFGLISTLALVFPTSSCQSEDKRSAVISTPSLRTTGLPLDVVSAKAFAARLPNSSSVKPIVIRGPNHSIASGWCKIASWRIPIPLSGVVTLIGFESRPATSMAERPSRRGLHFRGMLLNRDGIALHFRHGVRDNRGDYEAPAPTCLTPPEMCLMSAGRVLLALIPRAAYRPLTSQL